MNNDPSDPSGDNVVSMKSRKKKKVQPPPVKPSKIVKEQMLNLPPATKWLALLIIAVYFVQEVAMYPDSKLVFFNSFGFVPARVNALNSLLPMITPVTYMFIHGSLLHVMMNTLMLLAFGSGVEKWLGSLRFLVVFFVCGLLAAAVHFIINPFDPHPVIGASGATSGLFAVGLVYLQRLNLGVGSGPYGLLPLIVLWIVISVVFGVTGGPGGQSIAWIAHIGGFLSGFAVLKLMRKL